VLRWGFIGAGAIAQTMATELGLCAGNRLVAVASRTPTRAATLASTYAVRVESSLDSLLSATDVDVVYVATPAATHADLAVRALQAGKHVLIEKPMATNGVDAQRIVHAAKASGRFCMEAMWTRFIPAIESTKTELDAGRLGQIRQFSADFSYAVKVDPTHHFFAPEGGGALLDRGVYGIALAIYLLGPVSSVASAALIGTTGVDEDAVVTLTHTSGALSTITASLRSRGNNEASVRGTAATLTLNEPFFAASRYNLVDALPVDLGSAGQTARPVNNKVLSTVVGRASKSAFGRQSLETAKGFAKAGLREVKTVKLPYEGAGYSYQLSAVSTAISAGLTEEPRMTLQSSLTVMDVMDRARTCWTT
jgi:predicted dehydrogenase